MGKVPGALEILPVRFLHMLSKQRALEEVEHVLKTKRCVQIDEFVHLILTSTTKQNCRKLRKRGSKCSLASSIRQKKEGK